MRVSLIVAVASNGVIGNDGELPWHLPADLARFRRLTMGHHLIVGRKTWQSIGRPLAGRHMIVLSRRRPELPDGVGVAPSLDAALESARDAGDSEAFVAGGHSLYALALPIAERIYWTEVDVEADGDVHFPEWSRDGWSELSRERGAVDDRNPIPHSFVVYERRPN